VAAEPCATFPARFQEAAAKGRHDLVFVSQVFYTSAGTSGPLEALAAAVPDSETFIVIDGYHGFVVCLVAGAPERGYSEAGVERPRRRLLAKLSRRGV